MASPIINSVVTSRPPSSAMPWKSGCSGSLQRLDIACSTCLSRLFRAPAASAIVKATNATASAEAATSRALSAGKGSVLATATEDGGASRDANYGQWPAACGAGLAGAAVDEKLFLLAAHVAPRVAIAKLQSIVEVEDRMCVVRDLGRGVDQA